MYGALGCAWEQELARPPHRWRPRSVSHPSSIVRYIRIPAIVDAERLCHDRYHLDGNKEEARKTCNWPESHGQGCLREGSLREYMAGVSFCSKIAMWSFLHRLDTSKAMILFRVLNIGQEMPRAQELFLSFRFLSQITSKLRNSVTFLLLSTRMGHLV